MDYNQNNNQYNGYQPNVEPTYQPPQPPVEPNTQQAYYQQPVAPDYTQPQYNAPQYDNQYNVPQYGAPQAPMYNEPIKEEGKGMGIASLVLGILSVTCCCGGWLPSILAIIFGIISKSKKKDNNGMALAGIILGAIGIVFSIISIIILSTGSFDAMLSEMTNELYYY